MATRLKEACATMFMPEAPRPVGDGGEGHPEERQPGQLHPFAVGQAEQQPVDDDGQDDARAPGPGGSAASRA